MRLGKVKIISEYIVDLDNEEMVQHAKDALYEDFFNIVTFGDTQEFDFLVDIDKDNTGLKESDIPDFLKELTEEEET